MDNNNSNKKYYYDSIPERDRTDADPVAKQFGQAIVDKFEQEKSAGKTVEDIRSNQILNEEMNAIDLNNVSTQNRTQLCLHGNQEHNTVMVSFTDRSGNVADEICSSKTPEGVTDRDAYYDDMQGITAAPFNHDNPILDDNSSIDSGLESLGEDYKSPSSSEDIEESDEEMADSPQENVEQNSTQDNNNNNTSSMEIGETPIEPENQSQIDLSNDSSKELELKVEEQSASSRKRKREDSDEDYTGQSSSKRVDVKDSTEDSGNSLLDSIENSGNSVANSLLDSTQDSGNTVINSLLDFFSQ